jgi:tetratricopeptide (TPR) repeat protein
LAIAREIGDRHTEGINLGSLGNAYAKLGETHKAMEFHKQHIKIAHDIGDREGEAKANWNLGLAYKKEGEIDKAIIAMRICVEYEQEINHPNAEKDAAHVEELRKKQR